VRLTWHYFAIITVVFSLIFYFLAVSMKPLTGGDGPGSIFRAGRRRSHGAPRSGASPTPRFQYFFILRCS